MQQNTAMNTEATLSSEDIDGTDDLIAALDSSNLEQNQYQYRYLNDKKGRIDFEGFWGYSDDTEPSGSVGGFIAKRPRLGYIKGDFTTDDNSSNGKIVGIFKKGYFNGRIIIPDTEPKRITGLYTYDTETRTAYLQWMTFGNSGWAEIYLLD